MRCFRDSNAAEGRCAAPAGIHRLKGDIVYALKVAAKRGLVGPGDSAFVAAGQLPQRLLQPFGQGKHFSGSGKRRFGAGERKGIYGGDLSDIVDIRGADGAGMGSKAGI